MFKSWWAFQLTLGAAPGSDRVIGSTFDGLGCSHKVMRQEKTRGLDGWIGLDGKRRVKDVKSSLRYTFYIQGANMSHLGKRKIILEIDSGDMLVFGRVFGAKETSKNPGRSGRTDDTFPCESVIWDRIQDGFYSKARNMKLSPHVTHMWHMYSFGVETMLS